MLHVAEGNDIHGTHMVAHGFYGCRGNFRCMTVEVKRSAEAIHTDIKGPSLSFKDTHLSLHSAVIRC
jgi:hypothetical protein